MTNHQRLPDLDRVVYYRAPEDRKVTPSQIPDNCERIEILTGGRVWHEDDFWGKYYGRGTIFRHAAGEYTVHSSQPGNPYRCLVFNFQNVPEKRYPRVSRWTTPETLSIFRQEVLSTFHNPDHDRRILRDYIWSTVNWHTNQSTTQSGTEEMPSALRQALTYLNSHPESNISVEELANMTHYSKAHFHSLFKKHIGMTPHRYHLGQRIRSSCQNLATSDMPIADISHMYGFESLENFYRSFKRLIGRTPANYRREHSLPT